MKTAPISLKHRKFLLPYLFTCICFIHSFSLSAQHDSLFESDRARISIGKYFSLLKTNAIGQVLSPLQVPQHWAEAGGFALYTAGLMRHDRSINTFAKSLRSGNPLLADVSSGVTRFGGRYALITMVAIGATGWAIQDRKLFNTSLLASQAYMTSGVWIAAIKFMTGRERPSYINPNGQISTGRFHGPLYKYQKINGINPEGASYSSSPSGHAGAAFSIATTFAEMYKDKPAVVIISYTSASLVALSRITENKHWASDVLISSMLGYLTAKQAARNFRKQSSPERKTRMDFGVSYACGTVMPSVKWKFP